MTSIKLTVNGAHAAAEVSGVLTGGMVGIPIYLEFDSTWDDLDKTLVCKGAGQALSIVGIGTTATVAHEVMQAGSTLFLGVEGRNTDSTLVIPTIWVNCGVIQEGANASDESAADPTNPVWAQLQQQIGCLEDLETESKDDLVEAVNEALNSLQNNAGLSADEVLQLITQQLEAYSWEETDPTVPDWAKAAVKPTYTPNEIGAEKAGNVVAGINAHNRNASAHQDIRNLINAIVVPNKLSALTNDLYTTMPMEITYDDGSVETVNMVVTI